MNQICFLWRINVNKHILKISSLRILWRFDSKIWRIKYGFLADQPQINIGNFGAALVERMLNEMRPKHFTIHELADPSIIAEHGEDATWAMLDPKLLPALDWLRGIFGPILINGGRFKESGLRRKDTKTGSARSAHKSGQAYDLKPLKKGVDVTIMYDYVLANESEAMRHGITEVEDIRDTPTWMHISCRPHTLGNRIRIVRP